MEKGYFPFPVPEQRESGLDLANGLNLSIVRIGALRGWGVRKEGGSDCHFTHGLSTNSFRVQDEVTIPAPAVSKCAKARLAIKRGSQSSVPVYFQASGPWEGKVRGIHACLERIISTYIYVILL